MEVITKYELRLRKKEILEKIRNGAVFIHPTDTIYGISCNALNENAVKKVRKIKQRKDTPFSVWVPSKEWIKKHCHPSPSLNKWLQELPGTYTLILGLKNKESLAPSINPESRSVGVRMPDHWLHKLVEDLGTPIVTTSANRTGQPFMTSLEDLDPEIKITVDFIIYEGEKKVRPSKLVNLTEEEKIIER